MKHLRVLKHLFKRVPEAFLIALEFWSEERKKPKYLKNGSCKQWDWKQSSMSGKPFHLIGNVPGISNQKFCRNGKRPWCQVWELPQKASSSRLVQNGSTLTKLELVTISSDKLNMLWPSFTLVSDMYYLFFSRHLSYIHTLPWPKTSQAQIWNQNIHSCQYPAGIFDLLSAFISCWFSSSLGHPTWYFFQS